MKEKGQIRNVSVIHKTGLLKQNERASFLRNKRKCVVGVYTAGWKTLVISGTKVTKVSN